MSLNMTTYLADALLKHAFKAGTGTAYTQPTTVYVSLHTADPTKAGLHTAEVSGGSYTREAVTFGAPSTNGSGDTSTERTLNSLLSWAQATADWGTVTHIGVEDASTAGNMLAFGPLTSSKVVQNGDTFTIPANNLSLDLG